MTLPRPAQDKTTLLNGLRFHYREWGTVEAPPLLMLHGFSDHARTWDPFAEAMQDRFHVLVLDQRGHGETEWATDYGWERWIEDIDAFVRVLGLENLCLVGHSMGGAHAYRYTGTHPDGAHRLVILDESPGSAPTPALQQAFAEFMITDIFDDPAEAVQAWKSLFPRAPVSEIRYSMEYGLIKRPDGRWTYRYDGVLRSSTPPRRYPDEATSWKLLSKITCSTLIIRAEESEFVTRAEVARMAAVMAQGQVVEVADTGHMICWENPSGLIVAVRSFLLDS